VPAATDASEDRLFPDPMDLSKVGVSRTGAAMQAE
jgi:hypothetical protein